VSLAFEISRALAALAGGAKAGGLLDRPPPAPGSDLGGSPTSASGLSPLEQELRLELLEIRLDRVREHHLDHLVSGGFGVDDPEHPHRDRHHHVCGHCGGHDF